MFTSPRPSRLCVPAAVVVIHGLGCATVAAVGPLLPAEALTHTPAAAAFRNASSTLFVNAVVVPEIEELIASTPSSTAWLIAADVSMLLHEPLADVGTTQHAL